MNGPFAGIRVLDLTEGGSMICGKMFGDLGADVIKVEMPGGSPSRKYGPHLREDLCGNDAGLLWLAYNVNKRGITLNLESEDGQSLFKGLVSKTDIVLESFEPGYLEGLGLDYEAISSINPRIILTSITPFGQTGPFAHFKGSELVCWSMGGGTYVTGDPDRPPVWISFPQAALHAGVEAVVASLIAHLYREVSGEGQHVDVSIQQCVVWILMYNVQYWDLNRVNISRSGSRWVMPNAKLSMIYPCKDGYIYCHIQGGYSAFVTSNQELVSWMDECGMAPEWLKRIDWFNGYEPTKITQELVDSVEAPFLDFFATKTKGELYERAVKRGILLAPVNTPADIAKNRQLAARDFWVPMHHPELGREVLYPSPGVRIDGLPYQIRYAPPTIGQHNVEVYVEEMGLSLKELEMLKEAGII